jgi:hypothetical protein
MSNDPKPKSVGDAIRWIITGCLGIAAAYCVFLIASSKSSTGGGEATSARLSNIMGGFAILDVLAFIGIGVWMLRPPALGAVASGRYWVGKIALTLGLGLSVVIFLFITCLGIR